MPTYESVQPRRFVRAAYPPANGWDLRSGMRIHGSTEIIIDIGRRLEDLYRSASRILAELDGPFEYRGIVGDIEHIAQEAELLDWYDELLEHAAQLTGDPAQKQVRDQEESLGEEEVADDGRE